MIDRNASLDLGESFTPSGRYWKNTDTSKDYNPRDLEISLRDTESIDLSEQSGNKSHGSDTICGYSREYDSKIRFPNFHKEDERVKRIESLLSIATRIQDNTRYFVKGPNAYTYQGNFKDVDNPYYYYWTDDDTSSTNSPCTKASNNSGTFDLKYFIMTEEEQNDINSQFPKTPTPFKRRIDYFNPVNYITHFYFGQIFAAIVLLLILVFGTIGYLVSTVKNMYAPIPPEVYDILSPYQYPHLSAIRTSLIDPDTPKNVYQKDSLETGEAWDLVFSDEFNADGRTFFEGDDQFFTSVDIHYAATNDLEYYIPEMVETRNGSLRITLDAFPTNGLDYRSAMLQSWNQLCFSLAAIVEVSIKLPGFSQMDGLWPAIWSLGNLARPGYRASTDGVWPYTYDECDYGITPNQSSPDGISFLPGQRLSKCTCVGEDHPGLGTGRGAPEIDIIEGFHNPHDTTAMGIQTLQVAPFDPWWRPDYHYLYIEDANITQMKKDTGSQTQEAIAAGTILNDTWFESNRNSSNNAQNLHTPTYFQKFGFEYQSEKTEQRDSYINFFAANISTLGIRGDALHPTGNIGWRQITKEPMSLVFNLGLSETWSAIDFGSLEFPAVLEIDYIRIYQPKNQTSITCDPEGYPTTEYINDHLSAYQNDNLTSWEQAGFKTPKNSLMNHCW